MFGNVVVGSHLVVLVLVVLVDVGALVLLWRDRTRSQLAKVVWTVVVLALPLVGALGFLVNWALGRLADRLNRAH
jgi:hypothetical protein